MTETVRRNREVLEVDLRELRRPYERVVLSRASVGAVRACDSAGSGSWRVTAIHCPTNCSGHRKRRG
jgi:hypothetical protein